MKMINGVSMIPFGLLAGFVDQNEIRIIELAENGFRFRMAKNQKNIENTEKGSPFYPEELPFLRVYLFNRKSMQSVMCGRCGIKENFYVESNRLYKNRRTKSKERA